MSEVHQKAFALDVDRTLFKSDLGTQEFAKISARRGVVDAETIEQAQADKEAAGESFDVLRFLETEGVDQEDITFVREEFARNEEGVDYLYPGSRELLSDLKRLQLPHFLLTRGGRDNQWAKIRAGTLDHLMHHITPEIYKGELIGTWWNGAAYEVPVRSGASDGVLVAKSIHAVDDNPLSFIGLPENCDATLRITPGKTMPDTSVLPSEIRARLQIVEDPRTILAIASTALS